MYDQRYPEQFSAMVNALLRGRDFIPTDSENRAFKSSRLRKAVKALRTRNVLMPATGNYLSANSRASFTCFTQPLGYDVIVVGCSLSCDQKPEFNDATFQIISGEFRVRPPQPLSTNYIQPQLGFAPATYSIYFPAPFLLNAGDQIATDFGFNAPESDDPGSSDEEQQIVYFAVRVDRCVDEQLVIEQMRAEVEARQWQRRLLIPALAVEPEDEFVGSYRIGISPRAQFLTRPLNATTLLTGLSIKGGDNMRIRFLETATQHNFIQGGFIKGPNMFWAFTQLEPEFFTPYYAYMRFPVPHLLRAGAQISGEAIAGLAGDPTGDTVISLTFETVTI